MTADKPPPPSLDPDQPKGPVDTRPFLYNPDLAVPPPEAGPSAPAEAGSVVDIQGGASDGYWLHDAGGPSRYVPPAADRGKSVDRDPKTPAKD